MNGEAKDFLPAIQGLASSLRTSDISSELSSKLGELCFSIGNMEAAEYYFCKAISSDGKNVDAFNNLGVIHFQAGNYLEAEKRFLEAIRLDPGKKEAAINLSGLYSCVKELAERDDRNTCFCPCCGGRFPSFIPGGVKLRPNARCPRCHSLERHRLIWLYMAERTNISAGNLKVLHFAPETCIQNALEKIPGMDYTSADLCSPQAMVQMDITDIRYADETFDVILCNHVLEHIPDDRKAMSEMYRVLKPGGWAILQVPIDPAREKTFEDPGILSPRDRERFFGQADHVRWYGRDYPERLRHAGFHVRIDDYAAGLDDATVMRCGILREDLYFCTRPASSPMRVEP
jgi:hypothetical protein